MPYFTMATHLEALLTKGRCPKAFDEQMPRAFVLASGAVQRRPIVTERHRTGAREPIIASIDELYRPSRPCRLGTGCAGGPPGFYAAFHAALWTPSGALFMHSLGAGKLLALLWVALLLQSTHACRSTFFVFPTARWAGCKGRREQLDSQPEPDSVFAPDWGPASSFELQSFQ